MIAKRESDRINTFHNQCLPYINELNEKSIWFWSQALNIIYALGINSFFIVGEVSWLQEWETYGLLSSIWAGPSLLSQLSCYWYFGVSVHRDWTPIVYLPPQFHICSTIIHCSQDHESNFLNSFLNQQNSHIKSVQLNQPSKTKCVCVCVCVWVTQSYPTLWNPMDCSLPGSSVHGILQARLLKWIAIPFSRGSFWKILPIICHSRGIIYSALSSIFTMDLRII